MGGGASSPAGNLAPLSTKAFGQKNEAAIMPETNKDADGARIDNLEAPNPNAHARSKPTRQRIFDKVSAEDLGGDVEKSNSNVIDDETRELLTFAFSGFYFLQSNSTDKNQKLDVVIRSMEREEIDENVRLITEGESGDRLYVVDSGELEVTINGEVIRTLRRSNIVGELSLLYDAPRTATVRSITKVVVWSLKRDVFKRIQAMSASAAYNERARWLINCPELAVLSAIDLSRLVGTLKMQQFDEGDYIYKEGDLTDTCVLIEKGVAEFLSTKEPKERNNLDSELGITRPRRMTSAGIYEPPPTTTMVSSFDNSSDGYHLCNVNEGCLLGIGILRSKAGMEDPWVWTKLEGELEDEDDLREGAISPYSVIAKCDMQCLTFEVNVFENLFGPVGKVLQPKKGDRKNSRCNGNIHLNREIKFDSWKFRVKHILGAGTFGVVTLAEYRADNDSPPLIVACKSLSKQAVIETGQLRHVLDERRLLALMDSRFVIKLYGAYQTPHQLVMVTEPLDGGDLWSVIYEVPQFVEINGLPPKLVRFYATSIALALSHIHEQGIAYRDLKPENVMLDIKGHLRIIDFGFAKRVPFIKIDHITREEKVCHKTYTLCGTPEYLSPELIFNLGHDQSSDLWAFGVLLHEMFVAITPFAPKRSDNVTELFTNIAMVKKNGLKLMPKLMEKDALANNLVQLLLKPEPTERLGRSSGSTRSILEHEFFSSVDVMGISRGEVKPDYIPVPTTQHEPATNLAPAKPFYGDQTIFADFTSE